MSDFPSQVNSIQAPAVEGDFASANPRKTVLAGEGALIAGTGVIGGVAVQGAVVGRFGWLSSAQIDNDSAPAVLNTFGFGQPAGLVARRQVGLITQYLGVAVFYLQSGFQIACFNDVDMWVKNAGTTPAIVGQKAFANFADGSAFFANAGTIPAGGSGSASSVAASTASANGTIIGNVFTAANTLTGNFYPGASLTGTGVATGTKIISQILPLLAGEANNGLGRYLVNSAEQNATLTLISATYGTLTVGGTVVAGFAPGQTISGTNVVAGTTITQQLTGTTGVAGTYVVDNNTVVSSTAIAATGSSVETKWIARSEGLAGELIKISNVT